MKERFLVKSSTSSLYFHAAKIRKILVTSKYSGRNLLLSCSFSIMLRVDAGKRLLKKQKSGYFHKGNNHLFLYYSCSYTLTSTSPFLFSRFHRYTSRCSSPWLELSGAGHWQNSERFPWHPCLLQFYLY